jgi:hypothetical protein
MDSNHNPRGGTGAEGMAYDDGSDIPKFVYNLGRTTGYWENTYNNVSKEILGRVTRLLYRTYIDDYGKPCGLSIAVLEKTCPPQRERDTGLPHGYDDNGRMVCLYERVQPRYYWGPHNFLRCYRTVSRNTNNEKS